MPKMRDDKEIEIKRAIRDARVIDPLISINKIQKYLFKKGFKTATDNPLDINYLGKLIKKIRREAIVNIDMAKIQERMVELKEKHRIVYERLARIIYYNKEMSDLGIPPPTQKELLKALDLVIKWDTAVLDCEMSTGIFERHNGKTELEITGSGLQSNDLITLLSALPENEKIQAINTINEIIVRAREARTDNDGKRGKDAGGNRANVDDADNAVGKGSGEKKTDHMAKDKISVHQMAPDHKKHIRNGMARDDTKDNSKGTKGRR
ncbi:hypothetical protein KAU19_02845 [Candidatus Parcubacteria bacterium]|nr:hypothetical protein [Candidatus Parcubacteria bacterium]